MQDRLSQLMKAGERVLLVGPPALAKTSRIEDTARALNYDFEVSTPGIQERTDFGGVFCPDVAAGVCRLLPLEQFDRLRKATKPTLWLWDDLGNAPTDVQAALKGLVTRGGPFYRHPYVTIWAATNRPGDKTGVNSLHEALRSEFHFAFAIATPGQEEKPDGATIVRSWKEEIDAWCDWAFDQNADPAIVAWHRSTTGRTLYQWKPHADPAIRMPDFRSWHTVIRAFKAGVADLSTVGAAIGKPAAAEFMAYARLADKLPTPEQVWMDPLGAPVPSQDDPASLYLCAGMLSAAVTDKHAGAFCQYIDRMPRVFAALAGRDAFRKLGAKLSGSRDWAKWWVKNEELFASRSGK